MAQSTIADSILNILRSQERKQETETNQSLQAMQMNLTNERENRKLKIEEINNFVALTEKLEGKVQVKKNAYLESVYNNYFSSIYLKEFKDYMGKDEGFKEGALDTSKSDGLHGLRQHFSEAGFSEDDARKMSANLFAYVSGGKTNSETMQDVVNMFLDKGGKGEKRSLRFVNAARKAGILSKDEDSYDRDIKGFQRALEFDLASTSLMIEGVEAIQEGDLELDRNYEDFLGGKRLAELDGKTIIPQSGPSDETDYNVDTAIDEFSDAEWGQKFGSEGMEAFNIESYDDESGTYSFKDSFKYDPTETDIEPQYEGVAGNITKIQKELITTNEAYSKMLIDQGKKIAAHDDGSSFYSSSDRAKDATILMGTKKAIDIYSSRIKANEVIVNKLQKEYDSIIYSKNAATFQTTQNRNLGMDEFMFETLEEPQAELNPYDVPVLKVGEMPKPQN